MVRQAPVCINKPLLPNCAYRARLGVSTFHWFLSACNLSLNFFGTDCAQVFDFSSCPNVRNTHGSVGRQQAVRLRGRRWGWGRCQAAWWHTSTLAAAGFGHTNSRP